MAPTQALPPLWSADTTNPHSATRATIALLSIILGVFSATLFFIITSVVHKICHTDITSKTLPSLCKYNLAKTLEAGNMIVQLSSLLSNAASGRRVSRSSETSDANHLHHEKPGKPETHRFETRSIRAGSDLLPRGTAYTTRRVYKRSSMSEQINNNTSDTQYPDAIHAHAAHKVSRSATIQALKRTQTS